MLNRSYLVTIRLVKEVAAATANYGACLAAAAARGVERKRRVSGSPITDRDREMAQRCVECPVCRSARRNQRGLAFWFVKLIEGGLCPYCKAYERVYGRKAHEATPG
jgi:hypothetical protein